MSLILRTSSLVVDDDGDEGADRDILGTVTDQDLRQVPLVLRGGVRLASDNPFRRQPAAWRMISSAKLAPQPTGFEANPVCASLLKPVDLKTPLLTTARTEVPCQ